MRKTGSRPPAAARKLLEKLAFSEEKTTIGGDLEEYFRELTERRGISAARRWYRAQVLRSLPALFRHSIYWSLIMLKNHIKLAVRQLLRRKVFTFLNLTGLALGLACSLLIALWVQDETGYDRFHSHLDQLFMTFSDVAYADGREARHAASYYPLAGVLTQECAGTVAAARFQSESGVLLRSGDRASTEDEIGFADPAFLDMFTFPFLEGNPAEALQEPGSAILTESAALKYFGDADPIGRVLQVENRFDVKVTGVLRDVPASSSLSFDILCPFTLLFGPGGKEPTHWGGNPLRTYVRLQDPAAAADYERRMTEAVVAHMGEIPPNLKLRMRLQPFSKIHLHALGGGGGLIVYVSIFSVIALFVLVIACVNFMNLATARAGSRAGEVGLRKVVGAGRPALVRQFMGEAGVLVAAAFGLALALVAAALPFFNRLASKQLAFGMLGEVRSLPLLAAVLAGTALLSGSYPAFFLSAFQPVRVLKSSRGSGDGTSRFRRFLVVGQFAISIFLIITTVVIHRQLTFLLGKDLGYDRERLVTLRLSGDYDNLRLRFLQHPGVAGVTACCQNPLWITSSATRLDWEGKDPEATISMNWDFVDFDYVETMGMEILEGRDFSRDYATDVDHAYLLNQEAVRVMGVDSPVGKRFSLMGTDGTAIGIVRDFHFRSLHNPIQPLILGVRPQWFNLVMVRIRPGPAAPVLGYLESVWKEINPGRPFLYDFLDDRIEILYRSEQRMDALFKVFTGLAVVISCLGIFGLAAYMAERRTKEIGIRKVLGASAPGIAWLLSRDFSRWVLIANLLAWPAAWFAARRWLAGFAYRISPGPAVFLLAGAGALLIALLTSGGQALRAARTDPVDSLRYE